jgi:hypothetical protein
MKINFLVLFSSLDDLGPLQSHRGLDSLKQVSLTGTAEKLKFISFFVYESMTKKYKFNIFLGPLPLLDSVGTVHN